MLVPPITYGVPITLEAWVLISLLNVAVLAEAPVGCAVQMTAAASRDNIVFFKKILLPSVLAELIQGVQGTDINMYCPIP